MANISTSNGNLFFLPNPAQVPCDEIFEFFTDINLHRDGTEERLQLRQLPRRRIKYTIPLAGAHKTPAENTIRQGLRQSWLVPLWGEIQPIGDLALSQTVVVCDTVLYDLEINDMVLLYKTPTEYQVVEITSTTTTSISIAPSEVAMEDAILVPAKKGILLGGASISSSGHSSLATLTFYLEAGTNITESSSAQYLSQDITHEGSLFSGNSVSRTVSQLQELNDFSLGIFSQNTPWDKAKRQFSYQQLAKGGDEIRSLKEWVFRRAGRRNPFWTPTFESDLRLISSGTITSTFLVENQGLAQDLLGHVSILDTAGEWYDRQIANFQEISPTSSQITLDSPLNLPASEIKMVCHLVLVRLTSDTIKFTWRGGNTLSMSTTVVEVTE